MIFNGKRGQWILTRHDIDDEGFKRLMTPSELIDKQIADLADWRGRIVAELRAIVLEADPDILEEWKWNTAVWSHNGLVCAVGAFKDNTGINFFQGAHIEDPRGLFNAGLDAKHSRSVRFFKGDAIDRAALTELIQIAVAHNVAGK